MNARHIEGVVFDLDGTLIDSVADIAAALNQLLVRHHRRILSVAEVRRLIGEGAASLLHGAFALTGPAPAPDRVAALLDEFLPLYAAQPADPACLYPGAVETLEALAASGRRLGLCTNKPEAITRSVLDQLGLARFFAAVAGGDTLPVRKPDGGPVTWVAGRLGSGPAAMVGDSAVDIAAARAAGLPVIAVSYGYARVPPADLGADRVIDRLADLPAALAGL